MLVRRLMVLCGLAAALPMAASAARLIVCTTCDPTPIPLTTQSLNQAVQLPSNQSGAVSAEFINETGSIIDNFVFSTTINSGLTANTEIVNGQVVYGDPIANNIVAQNFSCDQTGGTTPVIGFFQNCSVTYDDASGLLTFAFYGVYPPEPFPLSVPDSLTTEANEQEGIPSCQFSVSFCQWLGTFDGTLGRGIFDIQLADWTPNTALYDYNNPNELKFTSGFNVPEPSTGLTFLTELLLFAGAVWLFRRRFHWSSLR